MATRKKTIRVPISFGGSGTIPDASLTTLGTPTVYIPENSVINPVTFTSVMVYIFAQDMSTATGGTVTEYRVACTLSGAGATTFTETDDLPNSGENWGGIFGPIDFTSHFTTNFGTVTSKSCQVDIYFDISTGTTTTVNGASGYFEITYTYNDAEANRIETVAIGLESITGALTTTANTSYGTIPQLLGGGGWLNGYASPTIRHVWAECKSASGTNNLTTAQVLNWGFNGAGGGGSSDSRNNNLGTDTYQFLQIDLSALTFTGTNTLDLWSSVATRYQCLAVTIYVSFEYVVSGTTRVLNYVEVPVEFESPINGTSSANAHRFKRSLLVPEPGTITQRSIAFEIGWNTGAAATAQIKVGAQASFRGYAVLGNQVATQYVVQHLLDSRSASGSALTLARGENDIIIDLYRSSGAMTNVSGVLKILYESDVSSDGIDAHSHTVYSLARQIDLTATGDNTISNLFDIPEANYWLQAAGLEYYFWMQATSAALMIQAEVLSGEAAGDGWRELYGDQYTSDNEIAFGLWRVRARDEFRRQPADPDTNRLNIETSRGIRTTSSTTFRYGYRWLVTFHTQFFTISGTISGSAGGTVNLVLRRADTGEAINTGSRVGDGSYNITAFDPVTDFYIDAYEDATHYGRSKQGSAGSGFDINVNPAGGGSVQKVYWG